MCFILLGDCGGTNIRLYLIESDRDYKNFRCINHKNYRQQTQIETASEKFSVSNYATMSEPIHEFLNECSAKFFEKFKNREDPEDQEMLKDPEIIKYSVRQVGSKGELTRVEKTYRKFWAKEPMEYKNKNAKFFRLFVAVAIAGNVVNNIVKKLANIGWPLIDGEKIRKEFSFGCFYLLNDFHANGFGVLSLQKKDKTLVNRVLIKKMKKVDKKKEKKKKNKSKDKNEGKVYLSEQIKKKKELTVIMGMGTGLGVVGILTTESGSKNIDNEVPKIFFDFYNNFTKFLRLIKSFYTPKKNHFE